jgi:hypothetical protein
VKQQLPRALGAAPHGCMSVNGLPTLCSSVRTCGARSGPLLVLGLRCLAGAKLQAMNRGLGDRLAELHHLL